MQSIEALPEAAAPVFLDHFIERIHHGRIAPCPSMPCR
jgi:hypothetical protein